MLLIINFKNPLLNSRNYLTLIKLNESRGYRELYFTITKLTPSNKLTAADMSVTLCYKCSLQAQIQTPPHRKLSPSSGKSSSKKLSPRSL